MRDAAYPFFSLEPDLTHEILGHSPMLSYESFGEFTQEIGYASLGATDEELKKIAAIYWYTVEAGIINVEGKNKVYGSALLTSTEELDYVNSGKPKFLEFDIPRIVRDHLDFPYSSI